MSDYSSENPVDQTNVTGAYQRPRSSLLPWVLFGITAGVLAALTIVLLRQTSIERQRADTEAQGHANAVARAEKAELAVAAANDKVAPLEEQVKTLTDERDAMVAKVKSVEEGKGGGKVEAGATAPQVTRSSSKKTAAKKTTKKKKHR